MSTTRSLGFALIAGATIAAGAAVPATAVAAPVLYCPATTPDAKVEMRDGTAACVSRTYGEGTALSGTVGGTSSSAASEGTVGTAWSFGNAYASVTGSYGSNLHAIAIGDGSDDLHQRASAHLGNDILPVQGLVIAGPHGSANLSNITNDLRGPECTGLALVVSSVGSCVSLR